jgi:hypothetical protein
MMEYKGKEMPRDPLHGIKADCPKTGAKFVSSYYNEECNAVIAYKDHNLTVRGNPKITLIERPEGAKFGNEISMQMNINGEAAEPYPIDSKEGHKVLEIYMPANQKTLDFLWVAIHKTRNIMQERGIING